LFRSLTVTDEDGRVTRRPRRFDYLCDVVGRDREDVAEVVRRFASPIDSLLLLSRKPIAPETEIDISHESVIARWRLLGEWVKREAFSANRYRDLAQATLAYRGGEAGAWRDPELAQTLRLRAQEGWNPAWAGQYWPDADNPSFEATGRFLSRSRWLQNASRALIALTVLALAFGIFFVLNERKKTATAEAEAATALANMATSDKLKAQAETRAAMAESAVSDWRARVTKLESESARQSTASGPEKQALEQALKQARAALAQADKLADIRRSEYERAQRAPPPSGPPPGDDSAVAALRKELAATAAARDEWKRQADALRATQSARSGSGGPHYGEPLRKPSANNAWFDYLDAGREELKGNRPQQALVYLYAAAALHPKSILDDGSSLNRSYFPHFELAQAYAAMGETIAARKEIEQEEQAGVIRRSPAFEQKLQDLKRRLASGTGSAQ
jgi:hypothetical protein